MAKSKYLKNHIPTGNIVAIVPLDKGIIELSFFQSCIMGICESAAVNNYEVMLCYSDYRDLRHIRSLVEAHKIDGAIVTRTNNPDMTVNYLAVEGVPFVTIGSYPDDTVIQVDHNHEEACKELTAMAILKGRKRIAFIGNQEQSTVTQRRFTGYSEALHEANLKIDPRLIHLDVETKVQAERIANDLLVMKADTIICTDEVLSYWIYAILREQNIQVPKNVELLSCYHSSALEDYVPAITTLKYDSKQIGIVAGDVLFKILRGKTVPTKQFLPYEINIRKKLPWVQ